MSAFLVLLVAALVMVPVALADDDDDDGGNGGTPTTQTFVSGTDWGADLVCLNDGSPLFCPATATRYGYVGAGWGAMPRNGSEWIWFPGVTGATGGADTGTASFSRTFDLGEDAISGSISLAADDYAEVLVNGVFVGSVGSTSIVAMAAFAQNNFTLIDLTTHLQPGDNVITVIGKNGAFVPTCNPDCTYRQNPAGVVFYGELTFVPDDDDGDDDDGGDDDGGGDG